MRVEEPQSGKYLYCIYRCLEPQNFTARGIGEQGGSVHTVVYGDLAAVVSDSPVVEYDNSRRNMLAHTAVLEEVMAGHTILPVRFGMVAPGEEPLREKLLKRRYDELNRLLGRMEGKVELGLKAFWYEESIYREIVAASPTIQQLRAALAGRPAEETYYERIKLGELVEAAMNAQRDADAAAICSALEPLAVEFRANSLITERMVLNAALLVEREREAEVDQAVQQLDADMGKRMIFKYVGSAPPYNFVNLTIHWN